MMKYLSLPVTLLLAVVASETFVSTKAALPPGYEDVMWCPEDSCDQLRNQDSGPVSDFHQCYDPETKEVVEAVWTGENTDVVAPTGWVENPDPCPEKKKKKKKKKEEKCKDSVRSGKKLGVISPETGEKEKYTCKLIKKYKLCKSELTSKKNKGYLAESICKLSCDTCSKMDTMKPTMAPTMKCENTVRSGKSIGVIMETGKKAGKKEKYTCKLIKKYKLCENKLSSKEKGRKGKKAKSICKKSCGNCSEKKKKKKKDNDDYAVNIQEIFC